MTATPTTLQAVEAAIQAFEDTQRGIPQAHIAAKLVAEIRAAVANAIPQADHSEQARDMVPAQAVKDFVALAKTAHGHWDADRDAKVGKLLLAMAGWNEGYDRHADALHAALVATAQTQLVRPADAVEPNLKREYRCVKTVADLVNNLLILDQKLPIFGAQYVDHPTRGRCAITVDPTVSRERVLDSRWIGKGETLNAAVIWTRAAQPTESKDADSRYPTWESDTEKFAREIGAHRYLLENDFHALHRFIETTEDDEGFDISKPAVQRLVELGVVTHCGFGRYQATAFGHYVHETGWLQQPKLPLLLNSDRDAIQAAAIQAKDDAA